MFREDVPAIAGLTEFEEESDDMAQWIQRGYNKGEIDRSGETLVPWWTAPPGFDLPPRTLAHCYRVIQNWRTSHAFPLNTFQVTLRNRARSIEQNAIVAQRLKRFSSVMNKLAREPKMKLSQMHDLGGCRAIMSSVEAVDSLFEQYCQPADSLFGTETGLKYYDYIRQPKPDGYRGIHVVGRYVARGETSEAWNGQRIEIQLRSRLQHAFATAVETVTTFTRMPLKFGGGGEDWRRFFSLMGSVLAYREGTPLVQGTPSDKKERIKELRVAVRILKVRQRLRGWSSALRSLPRRNVKTSSGCYWSLTSTTTPLR